MQYWNRQSVEEEKLVIGWEWNFPFGSTQDREKRNFYWIYSFWTGWMKTTTVMVVDECKHNSSSCSTAPRFGGLVVYLWQSFKKLPLWCVVGSSFKYKITVVIYSVLVLLSCHSSDKSSVVVAPLGNGYSCVHELPGFCKCWKLMADDGIPERCCIFSLLASEF